VYWSGYNPTTVYDGDNQYEIEGNFYGFRMVGDKISILSDGGSYLDGALIDTGKISYSEPEARPRWAIGELLGESDCITYQKNNDLLQLECGSKNLIEDFNLVLGEPFIYKGNLLFVATIFNENFDVNTSSYRDIILQMQQPDTKQVLVKGKEIISQEYSTK